MAMNGLGRAGVTASLGGSIEWSTGTCERIRYMNSTGTIVNDSTRLASSDTHTDNDKGENRYLAVPCNRNTGTNTMQMHKVDKNVGTATSLAPFTMARCNGSFIATWRSMFSMTTVPLSTRMPIASAKPPSVIVFSV